MPKLKERQLRSKPGKLCLFSDWGKIAIYLPSVQASVYSRILKEGGAKDVTLLSMPFQRKHLYSGIDEVEAIQFSYILSEPSLLESDQEFRFFVKSAQMANIHICSYFYVIECLCKVSYVKTYCVIFPKFCTILLGLTLGYLLNFVYLLKGIPNGSSIISSR